MKDYQIEMEFCETLGLEKLLRSAGGPIYTIGVLSKFKQHLIDTGQMVPAEKWINVKHKLPNNRTYVVIHWTCGYDIAEYKHGCFFTGLDKITGVTHWQEITAPGEHNTKS